MNVAGLLRGRPCSARSALRCARATGRELRRAGRGRHPGREAPAGRRPPGRRPRPAAAAQRAGVRRGLLRGPARGRRRRAAGPLPHAHGDRRDPPGRAPAALLVWRSLQRSAPARGLSIFVLAPGSCFDIADHDVEHDPPLAMEPDDPAVGKPVKVMWHRTDNFRHGRVHPMTTSRVRIALQGENIVSLRPAPHERRHPTSPKGWGRSSRRPTSRFRQNSPSSPWRSSC